MCGFPCPLGCRAYLLEWQEEGAFCVECIVFLPSPPYFPLCISVTGACLLGGVGAYIWLGCRVLPAIGTVSVLELAANSGSSRISQSQILNMCMCTTHVHLHANLKETLS